MRLKSMRHLALFAVAFLASCNQDECVQIEYREVETIPSVEEFRQVTETCAKANLGLSSMRLLCMEMYPKKFDLEVE